MEDVARMIRSRMSAFLIVALLASPLLFVGGIDAESKRSLKYLWDCGHIPFFFLWSTLLLTFLQNAGIKSRVVTGAVVVFFLLAGLLVEWVQSLIGREFSWWDVVFDLLGVFVSIGYLRFHAVDVMGKEKVFIVITCAMILLLVAAKPLMALIDERIAEKQFPLLADFSSPFEQDRFAGNSLFEVQPNLSGSGERHLTVVYGTGKYSTLELAYFPSQWQDFNTLTIDVEVVDAASIDVVCRINDRQHKTHDYAFNDRFNKRYQLTQGRQKIGISLAAVKAAPQGRNMDMNDIVGLSCFTMNLSTPVTVYFNRFELSTSS